MVIFLVPTTTGRVVGGKERCRKTRDTKKREGIAHGDRIDLRSTILLSKTLAN